MTYPTLKLTAKNVLGVNLKDIGKSARNCRCLNGSENLTLTQNPFSTPLKGLL